jgi:superfamily II RNA helicase
MLSATIDKEEEFAKWVESNCPENKNVVLAPTTHRVVPLTHYMYIDSPTALIKGIKDNDKKEQIKNTINKLYTLKEKSFDDDIYNKCKNFITMCENNRVKITPMFMLNRLVSYLNNNNMLPALCFVFSRKNVEYYAEQLQVAFYEEGSSIPTEIINECNKIIMKLKNNKEYRNLPEYINLRSLLSKGVGIHHSGMMPILREIVELMYSKGYIKVLFATETFAVGINMPTKSVVFTSLYKYTEKGPRFIYSHEYTQMAGRAGRRGIDTHGHVIHCPCIYRNMPSLIEYKQIMSGKPQELVSKYDVNYSLILNIKISDTGDCIQYIDKSMNKENKRKSVERYNTMREEMYKEIDNLNAKYVRDIPDEIIEEYIESIQKIVYCNNNKKRKLQKKIDNILSKYPNITEKQLEYNKLKYAKTSLYEVGSNIRNIEQENEVNINKCYDMLKHYDCLDGENNVTERGNVANMIHEVSCIVGMQLLYNKDFNDLNIIQIIQVLSCLTNISVSSDYKNISPCSQNNNVDNIIYNLVNDYEDLERKETEFLMKKSHNDEIHFDLIEYIPQWCNANSEPDCMFVLQMMQKEKEIFLGEWVKSLLKICNICREFSSACEIMENISLKEKLQEIDEMLMKYVVSNQSLYVDVNI